MDELPLDRIYIRDLHVRCIVGIYDDERREKQDVYLNMTLYADLSDACRSDDINDTVDYKGVKKVILSMIQESECFLIERLAENAAQIALKYDRALCADFTDFADGYFLILVVEDTDIKAGICRADGTNFVHRAGGIEGDNWGGFAEAVAVGEFYTGKLLKLFKDGRRHDSRAGHDIFE